MLELEKIREERYNAIAERVGGSVGKETVEALREFYEIFDRSMIDWFAGLYDPKFGGWYYSNGAKDLESVTYKGVTYPLWPDIESTEQSLRFINSSGLTSGKKYQDVLPERMKTDIARYLKGLQDEGGFFYNPQWGKEYTDQKLSRRARDLGACVGVLRALGYAPTYDTPTGEKGDYKLFDGTPAERKKMAVSAEGKVTTAGGIDVPENMRDKEAFLAYLDTLDIKTGAYSVGNTLTAQKRQIIFRDEQLKSEGVDYSLMDILINWLNENQNAELGLWHPEANYYAVNGLMKISGVYGAAGILLPNAEKAANAAIDAMNTSQQAGAVTDVYNTWFAAERVLRHIRTYGGDEGVATSERLLKNLRERAPEALRATKEKLLPFKKESGSFSYCLKASSARSQGCPVTHENMWEGDVNATIICSSDILNYIYESLGLSDIKVPIFGEAEMKRYIEIVEENYAKCK